MALPTGTVTFFFSDIEGSTRLVEALGSDYDALLERHHRILRDAFRRTAAAEVGTEGDSFFAVFPSAADAVVGAVAVQRALAAQEWPRGSTVRVRIGLHTGEARLAGGTYVGLDVHRGARIMASAHGGQVLVSEATRAVVGPDLADGIALRDLGEHRLRDLSRRERLFQVEADGLAADFPPLRTLDATPNNLPTQPSELVGREVELRTIREHLDSPGVRLLTLTGPGGIGKTRLALQAAADHAHRFPDGAFFVDLSAVRDAEGVLEALVEVLGVDVPARADVLEALGQELAQRHVLLLLDNVEQVVAAAEHVAELLRRGPRLTILATSREALRLRGEHTLPLQPLELPDRPAAPPTAEHVAESAAVQLFVERARQARPDFALTDENADTVAEICVRVDGLPLAIELAAARLRLLSPAELLDRLGSRLELLRGGPRDLPERHRTLRGTIEWSYDLLDEDERLVFRLLSLFPSARVEAVEEVAGALEPLARVDVLERLASLVDKSLVRSLEEDGARRLSMLDTIREYAAEQLAADARLVAAATRAHAAYFAGLAEAKRDELTGPAREPALDQLASELGNLQAAWGYFAGEADLPHLSALFGALWPLHDARGWYHGAVGLTNDLLEALSSTAPELDRADEEITLRVGVARGLLALRGYTEEVERLYREALALVESSGALPKRLPVLKSLASFHLYRGELDKTIAVGREVLQLAEQTGDTELQVEGDLIVGPALAIAGASEVGMEHLDRAIELFDPERHGRAQLRLGPNPGVAANAISALLNWVFGRPVTAAERAASALELGRRLRHPYSLAYATFHVGVLELWSGRWDAACDRADEVLAIAAEHDYPIWKAVGLVLRGVAAARLGDPDEGLARTEEGVSLYENLQTPPIFWGQIVALRAEALTLAGRPAEALPLLEEAGRLVGEGTWESAGLKVEQGELLAALGRHREAEPLFREALAVAGESGARMTQLRAATGLARLAGPAGGDAAETLRAVLETFSEGLDTPHVLEARAVLERSRL